MILATVLVFADKPADVVAGAVLTLVIPLGLTFVAFALWYLVVRRSRRVDVEAWPTRTAPDRAAEAERAEGAGPGSSGG